MDPEISKLDPDPEYIISDPQHWLKGDLPHIPVISPGCQQLSVVADPHNLHFKPIMMLIGIRLKSIFRRRIRIRELYGSI